MKVYVTQRNAFHHQTLQTKRELTRDKPIVWIVPALLCVSVFIKYPQNAQYDKALDLVLDGQIKRRQANVGMKRTANAGRSL